MEQLEASWTPDGLQMDSRWILDKKLAGLSPRKNCLNSRWTPGGVHLEYVGEYKVLQLAALPSVIYVIANNIASWSVGNCCVLANR